MAMNNAANRGQTYAGAFEFRADVQALKYAEEFVRVVHLETDAVVMHAQYDLVSSIDRQR